MFIGFTHHLTHSHFFTSISLFKKLTIAFKSKNLTINLTYDSELILGQFMVSVISKHNC